MNACPTLRKPRALLTFVAALLWVAVPCPAQPAPSPDLRFFRADRLEQYLAHEDRLLSAVSPERLRAWHDLTASEPHIAGTEGDLRLIETLARTFAEMGLEVEVQWIWPYLSRHVESRVVIEPTAEQAAAGAQPLVLSVIEPAIAQDTATMHAQLSAGFNAWSGSGDVAAQVVYANYGRKEDFERLRDLGVDCTGKVVLARYGGNFRGYKARFAEDAGAAALLIYTDPSDDGYMKGLMYPEGGFATPDQIQRGSVGVLDYAGDPLTPGVPADENTPRVDPATLGLPNIPVQPVSWSAAQQIMQRMTGPGVPEGWQGGLPFAYRLTGGDQLIVRVAVEQKREIVRTANVVATLRGSTRPDEWVIIGCHHDAWGFGACDPLAGLICLLEAARVLAELSREGMSPERSIVFACWGAEEHGIVGSPEWVEKHADHLRAHAVAYFNLDMAAMGPNFSSSASSALKSVILGVAQRVPFPADPSRTVSDDLTQRAGGNGADALIGVLGGGSDHVAFSAHMGIPSASMGGGGSRGTAYHSNYDTLAWYRAVVGEDYQPAAMVTRMTGAAALRLARADVVPLDAARYARDIAAQLDQLETRARDLVVAMDARCARAAVDRLMRAAETVLAPGFAEGAHAEQVGRALVTLERLSAVDAAASANPRPWYRSTLGAPDATSGYAAWALPMVRGGVESRDGERTALAMQALCDALNAMSAALEGAMVDQVQAAPPVEAAPDEQPEAVPEGAPASEPDSTPETPPAPEPAPPEEPATPSPAPDAPPPTDPAPTPVPPPPSLRHGASMTPNV